MLQLPAETGPGVEVEEESDEEIILVNYIEWNEVWNEVQVDAAILATDAVVLSICADMGIKKQEA